jgi:hypothetical protein
MARARSQTKVSLNAKPSAVDLQTIPYDGTDAIEEGMPVVVNAQGFGVKPTGGLSTPSEIVYINYVDSERVDVIDQQGDGFSKDGAPTLKLADSGHLTGIRGNGVQVGLPAASWHDGVFPTPGQGVLVNPTSGKFQAVNITVGGLYYGIVELIRDQRAFMHFTSRASVARFV